MDESGGEFKFRWSFAESERFKDLVINGNNGEYYEIIRAKSSGLQDVKKKVWTDIKKTMVNEFPRLEKMSVYQMKNHWKCLQKKYADDAMTIPRGDPAAANLPRVNSYEDLEDAATLKEKYSHYVDNESLHDSEPLDSADFDMEERKYNPSANVPRMKFDEVICLNVGGTRFLTAWHTLMKEPGSQLAKMCDPEAVLSQPAVFKDGAYFIDRDTERFRLILDYLRDGELRRGISEDTLFGLLIEAEHFQLVKLKEEINYRLQELCSVITLNVGGERFETTRETLKREPDSILAKIFDPDTTESPILIKDGVFFLDRDPLTFQVILSYLRHGELKPSIADNEALVWDLQKEVDFLKLPGLAEQIEKLTSINIQVAGDKYKETKLTVSKYPHSLLTRIITDKCESPLAIWDGRNNIIIDLDTFKFQQLWKRRHLKIVKCQETSLENDRFREVTRIAREANFLAIDEKLAFA